MSIYAKSARFDSNSRGLDETELRKLAPSIFATSAHESRSDRFQPIATIEVLRELAKENFLPVGAKQSVCRVEGKQDFTKHLIRLRRLDEDIRYSVGDVVCEILLKNANDGTSAYDLMAGLFRIRCLNSLVAQTSTLESVKVRHSGDVSHKVIEGTYSVLDQARRALVAPDQWSQINLNSDERHLFAEAAHVARFGEGDEQAAAAKAIEPAKLLETRRHEDDGADLWTTFNVVQENAVRGGLSAIGRDANNRRRRFTTRAVKGIDQDVKLNRALWILSEGMAKLKQAA